MLVVSPHPQLGIPYSQPNRAKARPGDYGPLRPLSAPCDDKQTHINITADPILSHDTLEAGHLATREASIDRPEECQMRNPCRYVQG